MKPVSAHGKWPEVLAPLPSLEEALGKRPHRSYASLVSYHYRSKTGLNLAMRVRSTTVDGQPLRHHPYRLRFLSSCCGVEFSYFGDRQPPGGGMFTCAHCDGDQSLSLHDEPLVVRGEERGQTLKLLAAALEETAGMDTMEALLAASDTLEEAEEHHRRFFS